MPRLFFDILYTTTGLLMFIRLAASAEHNRHPEQSNARLYSENVNRLRNYGLCGTPRPRVHYIEDHPEADPNLTYLPPATVLHWCDPSGGCCWHKSKRCSPVNVSIVRILFYAFSEHSFPSTPVRIYQSLNFTNHTECACLNFNDVPR